MIPPARAAESFRDQHRQPARLGQRLYELAGIRHPPIEVAPIFAGKTGAQLRNRVADFRITIDHCVHHGHASRSSAARSLRLALRTTIEYRIQLSQNSTICHLRVERLARPHAALHSVGDAVDDRLPGEAGEAWAGLPEKSTSLQIQRVDRRRELDHRLRRVKHPLEVRVELRRRVSAPDHDQVIVLGMLAGGGEVRGASRS